MKTPAADSPSQALVRMHLLIDQWGSNDPRSVFLRCYEMMTVAMMRAMDAGEFDDPEWVGRLLERFAVHYFDALDAYEVNPDLAPRVWRLAHDACHFDDARPLQQVLLGINAHINYDLALAVQELLAPEWVDLPPAGRAIRLHDYERVNDVIGATVDQVQDDLLEPVAPILRLVDVLMGGADEFLASRLLLGWRTEAWGHTLALLDARDGDERQAVLAVMEEGAVRTAFLICPGLSRE